MPQHSLYGSGVSASRQEERGRGAAEVMEPNLRQRGGPQVALEGAHETALVDRLTLPGSEDEPVVAVGVAALLALRRLMLAVSPQGGRHPNGEVHPEYYELVYTVRRPWLMPDKYGVTMEPPEGMG